MIQDTEMNDRISPSSAGGTENDQETIGIKVTGQGTDTTQPERLVIQVSQTNILSTNHRGTQSHASGVENKDTFACHASYQTCIATTEEHQTMVQKHAEDTAIPTTAHQTAIAARDTTQHHPHHRTAKNGLFTPTKTSTTVQSPIPGNTIHPDTANITAAMTQAVQQDVSKAIGDGEVSKQMLKNLERFDGKDRSKCLEWLSNIEIIAQHSKKSFRELICQSMSPSLLHIFSSVSAFASDQDIKEILLANYSDVPSMAEAVAKLQNMQIPPDEPLATFNAKYQQIHQVAYNTSPDKQKMNKTVIIDYVRKLPPYPRDKLLKKLARKDSYIKTLQDAFRNAVEINREISFVDATTGRSGETRITQINELDDSFPDYDINAMSTRSTDRSGNKSFDRSFDRSSSRSGSQNSSFNSRSGFRNNNSSFSSSNGSTQSRQGFGQKPSTQGNSFQPRNNGYQNRFDGNQGNGYNGNNTNRFEQRRRPTKFNHSQATPKAQVIFEYTDQNPWDVIHMVRNFISYMKGNPTQRQFFKTNKIVPLRFNTEVNKSEIQSSNLEQIQQAVNEDQDLVFDALVAADYIDEINTSNNEENQSA